MRNILLLPLLLLKAKSKCLLVSHACSMEHSVKDTFILFSFECFFLRLFPNQDMSKQRSYPRERWPIIFGGRGRGEERRDEEYMLHKRGICVKQKHMCEACKGV